MGLKHYLLCKDFDSLFIGRFVFVNIYTNWVELCMLQGEPEVHADQFDTVLKDNVSVVNDVTAESSEQEAITDHQCSDKELMIYEVSLLVTVV